MTQDGFFRRLERRAQVGPEPLRALRLVAGAFLLAGTAVAVVVAVVAGDRRGLLLAGTFWAIYGLLSALFGGLLEPLTDFTARALMDVGLVRAGGGYSSIETLVARGHHEAAAEAYRERAGDPRHRVEATLRRAALLAGPLGVPGAAAAELESLRKGNAGLAAEDDLRVGLALVDLYDFRLQDPGRAMAELRRLVDRHPGSRHARRLRAMLAALKTNHFGGPADGRPT